jgi:hypothetical protein
MDFDYYFNEAGDVQYCYYGNQYTWDPEAWGYYPGWTMIWSGSCGDDFDFYFDYSFGSIDYYWTYYIVDYQFYYSTWDGEWW